MPWFGQMLTELERAFLCYFMDESAKIPVATCPQKVYRARVSEWHRYLNRLLASLRFASHLNSNEFEAYVTP
jgi:hypothetical protein